MYKDNYYAVYFTMNTPDDKNISEMSYSELYWLSENLKQYKESIEDEINKRREILYDETRRKKLKILTDKYLDVIQKGTGQKSKNEALQILMDIFFHETE